MAKQITFTYNDKDYTLEYNRRSIRQMENEGFVGRDLDIKPMTVLPALFAGAFKMHHPGEKPFVINAIFEQMPDKFKLIETLTEMYNEPIEAMMDEPTGGNVIWTVKE